MEGKSKNHQGKMVRQSASEGPIPPAPTPAVCRCRSGRFMGHGILSHRTSERGHVRPLRTVLVYSPKLRLHQSSTQTTFASLCRSWAARSPRACIETDSVYLQTSSPSASRPPSTGSRMAQVRRLTLPFNRPKGGELAGSWEPATLLGRPLSLPPPCCTAHSPRLSNVTVGLWASPHRHGRRQQGKLQLSCHFHPFTRHGPGGGSGPIKVHEGGRGCHGKTWGGSTQAGANRRRMRDLFSTFSRLTGPTSFTRS